MLDEIYEQRNLSGYLQTLEDDLSSVARTINAADGTTHVVGCGDSYFAAEATVPFFQTVGAEIRVHTAYAFSRYVAPTVGTGDVVLPVSMSGNSARTLEGAAKAADRGATVVGISNSPDGRLNQLFDRTVLLDLETEPGWTPGTLTYLMSTAALFYIGVKLANSSDGRSHCDLFEVLDQVPNVIDSVESRAEEVAANLSVTDPATPFYVLGGGPNEATARYNAAKFLEVCDTHVVGQESEEFAHQEFWILEKTNPVFVIAPTGSGFSRTREVAECIREFGNDLVLVTDSPDLADLGKYAFEIEVEKELFSPLLYPVPLQFVSYYYALERGLDPDRRTNVDPFRKRISRKLTRGSEVEVPNAE